jgi:hypothetical protein
VVYGYGKHLGEGGLPRRVNTRMGVPFLGSILKGIYKQTKRHLQGTALCSTPGFIKPGAVRTTPAYRR